MPPTSGDVKGLIALIVTHPELAREADGWDPSTLSAGSGRKVSWKCELGHKWNATVDKRSNGRGCPVCSNNSVLAGFNDLATMNPELALQADGWDPTLLSQFSHKNVDWKCEVGHQWKSSVANRSARGTGGCPVCSNKSVLVGFNDLLTTHPELALQADGWDPTTVVAGSAKKLSWQCDLGHTWTAIIKERSSGAGNCPICSNKSILVGFNDLATTHPELAREADGWDPTTVGTRSPMKLAWRCNLDHAWRISIANRLRGTDCPVCSNNVVQLGFNDLATTNPELAREADGWNPGNLSAFSNKKVAWRCEKGHNWNATVANRSSGNGCPVCSNKSVLAGFNDLATTHPELASEANGWDPSTVVAGSHTQLGWRCDFGHTWEAQVKNRSSGTSCPVCSNKSVLVGFNDLLTTHPELAMQANGWDPTPVVAGSHKKVAWRCEKGHNWNASVASRSSGNGCPVCSNHSVHAGFNDLLTTHPELAREADGWDPTTVVAGSNKKFSWRCDLDHTWTAIVAQRSRGAASCPVCSNRSVLVGFNDLLTTHPELAMQADGWDPTTVGTRSPMKLDWRCGFGHSFSNTVAERSGGAGSCPVCANKLVLVGFNDLLTTHPELAMQADGWDPTTVVAGSAKKLAWRCGLGHQWKAVTYHRSSGVGCPVCSNKSVLTGFNDLATTYPELAMEADGWDPSTVVAGSGKKLSWRCGLGHRWKATVDNRSKLRGCPVCSNKSVLTGFNDLATTHPELAMEADGWDPSTVVAGSNRKLGWRCDLGHTWRTTSASRLSGSGCPSCTQYGFDPNKKGWLYLIEHTTLGMLQIGISNVLVGRLGQHSRGGWEVIEVKGPLDGQLVREMEQKMLRALSRRGAVMGHKATIKKFDGYTEAWMKASLKVSSIGQLLEWVSEDQGL